RARYPDLPEGDLSRLRANLVNQAMLAEIAGEIGVAAFLRLGDGEIKTGGASRPSILADAVEALLGAIFLDAGFDAARNVVHSLYAARFDHARFESSAKDAKTSLQEWLQARRFDLPKYEVTQIDGEAHRQTFDVRCDIAALHITTTGKGTTRRAAEQAAAAQALAKLADSTPGKSS
ncbi:MAG: ribonuclease III, partial [Betaproteobacteria bacterium]|nr:ribonuclease III [Betaproteobacteria bacterium]